MVERKFNLPGSAIGTDLDEVECTVYERMDANLVAPKRKASQGGKARRGGKTRERRDAARR